MKIEKRERPYKTVFFWMSEEEVADKALMASLQPQFLAWKAQNYLPVVMESGKGTLEDSVYMLLKRNLETIAKRDAVAGGVAGSDVVTSNVVTSSIAAAAETPNRMRGKGERS